MKTAKAWLDRNYSPAGQKWFLIFLAAVVVDAGLAAKFGFSQTLLHGIGFALVALIFSLLPDAAVEEWEGGRKIAGVFLGILCIPIGLMAFYSHLGYSASVRVGDMQRTGVINTVADDVRKEIEDQKALLTMFEGRLAELSKGNAWSTTVTANALRARMDSLNLAIRLEEQRGGCKAKCLERTKERDDVAARIAVLERIDDTTGKIEATKNVIASLREKSAITKPVQSDVVNQTNVGAQIYLAFTGSAPGTAIRPDEITQTFTNIMIMGVGSLVFLLLAPISYYKAGRNRRRTVIANVPPVEHCFSPPPQQPARPVRDDAEWAHAIRNAFSNPQIKAS